MQLRNDLPIYVQISRDIRERILSGDLLAGDPIMSTTQYATTYRINPATANKAFNELVADGIIYKQRGIGMFVTEEAAEILRAEGRQSYTETVLAPAITTGLNLGLSPDHILALVTTLMEES